MLQVQSSKDLNLWQTFHEIAEKSSKIVSLGAPSANLLTFNQFTFPFSVPAENSETLGNTKPATFA